jgi:hypothetical protein
MFRRGTIHTVRTSERQIQFRNSVFEFEERRGRKCVVFVEHNVCHRNSEERGHVHFGIGPGRGGGETAECGVEHRRVLDFWVSRCREDEEEKRVNVTNRGDATGRVYWSAINGTKGGATPTVATLGRALEEMAS